MRWIENTVDHTYCETNHGDDYVQLRCMMKVMEPKYRRMVLADATRDLIVYRRRGFDPTNALHQDTFGGKREVIFQAALDGL